MTRAEEISYIRDKAAFICDMDGVIYHGNRLIPGVTEFVSWLHENGKKFLFLTNSSERSPRELAQKLGRMGLDVSEDHFYTSALATAAATVKMIGDAKMAKITIAAIVPPLNLFFFLLSSFSLVAPT